VLGSRFSWIDGSANEKKLMPDKFDSNQHRYHNQVEIVVFSATDIPTVESHIHLLIRRVAQAKPRDMNVKSRSVPTNVAVAVFLGRPQKPWCSEYRNVRKLIAQSKQLHRDVLYSRARIRSARARRWIQIGSAVKFYVVVICVSP